MNTARRPNFLFLMTDQHRADHLGCYGNSVIKTPHLDSIALRGTRYERFHVASPVCMANRSTLMTGRMPSLHGVRHNGIALSRESTTFVELLRDAGYDTSLIGKSHLQNFGYDASFRRQWTNGNGGREPSSAFKDAGKAPRAGRDYDNEWTPFWEADPQYKVETPFYGFDHVELCTFHGDHVGGDYAAWLKTQRPDGESLRGRENAFKDDRYSAPQAWRTALPTEVYPSTYVAERACAWLETRTERREEPFFLMCSFPDPHHPYTPPGTYWDMYDPDGMELPKSFNARHTTPLVSAVEEMTKSGKSNREGYTPFTVSERECREIIALTYGMISLVDDCIGRIVNTLERSGLAENTIIVFTSDHGDWMGDHGLMLKGPLHYRGLIRVPFIWSDPFTARTAPLVSTKMSSTLDIARTILDRVGIAPYNGIQGESLLAPRGSTDVLDGRALIIESEQIMYKFGQSDRFRVRSLLWDRYRLSISDLDVIGELYDLIEDPEEVVNLWESPSHSHIKGRLMERLSREMIRLADDSPLPTALA